MLQLPIITTSQVWHVGNLAGRPPGRVASHEGHCVSVSHCPGAWAHTARLESATVWELHLGDAAFVDVLRAERSVPLRQHVVAWGAQQGLCSVEQQWRSWFQDEDEEWRYTLHATQDEALFDAESTESLQGPDGPAVVPCTVLVATQALEACVGVPSLKGRDAFDMLLSAYADETLPAVQGLWWCEKFAPEALSAPRGGIFPSRLGNWDRRLAPAGPLPPAHARPAPTAVRTGALDVRAAAMPPEDAAHQLQLQLQP